MWVKKGRIFSVKGDRAWNKTHAQVPVVDVLEDRLRIYYATRNSDGKSGISYIETDLDDPSSILYEHDRLILEHGELGTFDDSGQMPSCIIEINGMKHLYYVGWTTRGSVPYHNSVGLATSEDGGKTFRRAFDGPIIGVTALEAHFSGTSYVMCLDQGYIMYYLSCIGWKSMDDRVEPLYHIKYALSNDGVSWKQEANVAVDLEGDEGGLVSAAVVKENDAYRMWYGVRKDHGYREDSSKSYKIGYAESSDGLKWERKDNFAGIEPSKDGWDSEMISYPYVVELNERKLMFYNGNGFGRTGFGYAEYES